MYDVGLIKTAFSDLIGWRQAEDLTDSDKWQLSGLMTSSSGLFYNDVHPVLTFSNMASVATEFDKINDNNATERNDQFTEWLRQRTEAGIVEAVEAWFSQKSILKTANNLLEHTDLFTTTSNFNDLETSSGKIVGHRFTPYMSKSLALKLEKIKVQFDTNQVIQIHLFQSGKKEPIQSVNVNYTGDGSVQEESVNWLLKSGSSYFLAYNQDVIQGSAINSIYDHKFSGKTLTFPSGRYYEVSAFNVEEDSILELWDISKNDYTISTNYGMNVTLSVVCDYTDFIIQQKDLFKMVIYYKVAMKIMRELAFNSNSRVNRNVANFSREEIVYEIDGDSQGRIRHTVFGMYEAAMNSIQFNTSLIDKICLPCAKNGVRWTSAGP